MGQQLQSQKAGRQAELTSTVRESKCRALVVKGLMLYLAKFSQEFLISIRQKQKTYGINICLARHNDWTENLEKSRPITSQTGSKVMQPQPRIDQRLEVCVRTLCIAQYTSSCTALPSGRARKNLLACLRLMRKDNVDIACFLYRIGWSESMQSAGTVL